MRCLMSSCPHTFDHAVYLIQYPRSCMCLVDRRLLRLWTTIHLQHNTNQYNAKRYNCNGKKWLFRQACFNSLAENGMFTIRLGFVLVMWLYDFMMSFSELLDKMWFCWVCFILLIVQMVVLMSRWLNELGTCCHVKLQCYEPSLSNRPLPRAIRLLFCFSDVSIHFTYSSSVISTKQSLLCWRDKSQWVT
jgi:hypothetical protein